MEAAQSSGPGAQKKSQRAAEQDRSDVAQARSEWREWQPGLDPARLIFLDETGAATNMARRYGRCARGERLVAGVPHGHWKTTTFIAALRQGRISAPCVFDGPMNAVCFRAYVEQCLVPTLSPGDIVIIDNLSSHKAAGVREAIEATGASLRYLPPYSPISIRSSRSSPSSKPSCARSPPEQPTPSSPPSLLRSISSPQPSATTISQTQAIASNREKML